MVNGAEPPFFDQLARVCNRGHAPTVEPHHRPASARRVDHRLRVQERQGKRLLAEDDLAGTRRSNRCFGMQVVRQRDVDDVDVLAIDRASPVGGDLFPLPAGGGRRQRRLVAAAQQRTAETDRQVEEMRRLGVSVRVRLPHEALTQQGHT